jgi:chorismate dehydratase
LANKIKVGAVSYLNTKPLIYGFEQGQLQDETELIFDYPANIAKQLIAQQVDIALVPVGVLAALPQYHIVSNYCIGCNGAVASVCLFSDVPLQDITTILLDYQSRTSVALLKILLAQHWKRTPTLLTATPGFESNISGTTAGLVIGDRAFAQRPQHKYIYDLGEAWQAMTGLPFVFAVWASIAKPDTEFLKKFNTATAYGLQHLQQIAIANATKHFDLLEYYTKYIDYNFDANKKKALELFFSQQRLQQQT